MKKFSITLAVIFLLVAAYAFYEGFDKKNNYYQSTYRYSEDVNAYVGGDAYNYIINGTYFTGYVVLGTGSLIISSIALALAYYAHVQEEERQKQREERLTPNITDTLRTLQPLPQPTEPSAQPPIQPEHRPPAQDTEPPEQP